MTESQENNDRKHFSWGRREPEDSKERLVSTIMLYLDYVVNAMIQD